MKVVDGLKFGLGFAIAQVLVSSLLMLVTAVVSR